MNVFFILGLLLVTFILIGLFFSWKQQKSKHLDYEFPQIFSFGFAVVMIVVLIGHLVAIPIDRAEHRADIREFEAFRTTLSEQRSDSLSVLERTALTNNIIEHNQWLAKEQYWATSPWKNVFYDAAILDVKPIK